MTKTSGILRSAGAILAVMYGAWSAGCAGQDGLGTSGGESGTLSQSQRLQAVYSTLMGHVEAGKYDQVIGDVDRALVDFPGMAKLHFFRGFAYYQKGLLDRAVQDLTSAIQIDPTMKEAYQHRAWVYIATEQLDLALGDAARLTELDPAIADGYLARGVVFLKKEDFDQARLAVAKAMELDPGNEKGKTLLQQLGAGRRP